MKSPKLASSRSDAMNLAVGLPTVPEVQKPRRVSDGWIKNAGQHSIVADATTSWVETHG